MLSSQETDVEGQRLGHKRPFLGVPRGCGDGGGVCSWLGCGVCVSSVCVCVCSWLGCGGCVCSWLGCDVWVNSCLCACTHVCM